MSDEKGYQVGYCKPPEQTRFRPGQSGNPQGRPKKTKDLQKLFERELNKTMKIRENGEITAMTVREAFVKSIIGAAFRNDRDARRLLVAIMKEQRDVDDLEINAAAEAMLQDFASQQSSREGDDDGPES